MHFIFIGSLSIIKFLPHQAWILTSQLLMVEETGVPWGNHQYTASHRQLYHMPQAWVQTSFTIQLLGQSHHACLVSAKI